jgi:hypothetical protein
MLRWLAPLLGSVIALASCSAADDGSTDDGNALTEKPACAPPPACNGASGPDLGPLRPWKDPVSSAIAFAPFGNAGDHHRGRDLVVVEGEDQWIIGKFAYGLTDKDLKGEEVDIYVERGCAGRWDKLGSARTTQDGEHAPVFGIEDTGGRIYFQIPQDRQLPLGRHRVRLVVAGDHTTADMLVEVVTKETPMFVSDVDGTLTSSEFVEFKKLLTGKLPDAQPDAAKALTELVARGFHPIYLTARPEWLTHRTREFLADRGFPPGIIHTTTTVTGAIGGAAAEFKKKELVDLSSKGLNIRWAFGNRPSDDDAYRAASFADFVHFIFLGMKNPRDGQRIDHYSEILAEIADEPPRCAAAP